jgi:L-lactate dehydrogenase complex protein LldG
VEARRNDAECAEILVASGLWIGGGMSESNVNVIANVRRALGRTAGQDVPAAPVIEEPVARLVHTDLGLPELFIKRAQENKMLVEGVYVEALGERLVEFLRERECRKIALAASRLLEKVGVPAAVREAGLEAKLWPEMTLDEVYDFDVGVTDVWCAVAETGSLVIRPTPEHGRALSLVPPIHVAVLEPKNFVPDLVDLFQKLSKDGAGSGVSIITGPSKTADIEMNLVEGVHGPGVVKVFVLQ